MDRDIKSLYQDFLNKQCSRHEVEQLLDHFRTIEGNEDMVAWIEAEMHKAIDESDFIAPPQFNQERTKAQLLHTIRGDSNRIKTLRRYFTVAAALLAFAFIGYYLYKSSNPAAEHQKISSIYGDDVLPGADRATITLSDGTIIDLSEDHKGIVASGSALRYADGEKLFDANQNIQYATLSTPRGGQYRLTLPDGSKVILNAASSITYPIQFSAEQRKVELKGEAFFDVAKNRNQPFVVVTDQQQVIVTGTTFNINAYGDDNRTITTLVTGAVRVESNTGTTIVSLKPGQESVWNNGRITAQNVDTQIATGWAQGVFVFKFKTLAEILPQLERWYDIEVDINPIPYEEFYAEINRNTPLSTVLESMEQTSNLRFEIKERRLTLKKK
ncbi:FecR family protein [Sphingobacterium faecale]|uniref:FecR domain-containing protein n=1 Tax=Sphingobacterium faecale TaxID=2803775 RepID=A0ABS1R0M9_9SPHI|nr:FecR family protein [Sphingobacterium faecale]MBL1408230.1 FecR domain-containing protein [Sphingobacterium faecale]